MAYILFGFFVVGLSVYAFFLFYDEDRWTPASTRRSKEKPTNELFTWTDQAESVASDAGETPVHKIEQREGLDKILDTRFAPLNSGIGDTDPSFQWGKYTLRELEANFAAETPPLKTNPRRRRVRSIPGFNHSPLSLTSLTRVQDS